MIETKGLQSHKRAEQTKTMIQFYLRTCQHDDDYIDGLLQIKVHTDKRIQVHWQGLELDEIREEL